MIIWGWRNRTVQVAAGNFYCPGCRAHSAYTHQRVARYFTLYFIPLFPTQTLGEFVSCLRCSGQYRMSVLDLTPAEIDALLRPWTCGNCRNANPAAETHCVSCGARQDYVPPAGTAPQPEGAAQQAAAEDDASRFAAQP